MLRVDGGDVTFRHELARLAVAEQVPAARRMSLHRRMLAALRGRGRRPGDPARLAHHAEAAGDSEAVLAYAPEAAARAAALGAHREAVQQYRRVLRHADRLPDAAAGRAAAALGLRVLPHRPDRRGAGRRAEALRDLGARSATPCRVGDTQRCLSRLNWFAGRNEQAEGTRRGAVECSAGTESVELAMALQQRGPAADARLATSPAPGSGPAGRWRCSTGCRTDRGARGAGCTC